jgi:hypothetical protein
VSAVQLAIGFSGPPEPRSGPPGRPRRIPPGDHAFRGFLVPFADFVAGPRTRTAPPVSRTKPSATAAPTAVAPSRSRRPAPPRRPVARRPTDGAAARGRRGRGNRCPYAGDGRQVRVTSPLHTALLDRRGVTDAAGRGSIWGAASAASWGSRSRCRDRECHESGEQGEYLPHPYLLLLLLLSCLVSKERRHRKTLKRVAHALHQHRERPPVRLRVRYSAPERSHEPVTTALAVVLFSAATEW